LSSRIKKDEKEWFPYCLSLSKNLTEGSSFTLEKKDTDETDDSGEALLIDLKHIMIRHLSGEYDENLCHAVIFSMSTLSKDIKQHNRIRYRILQPMVSGMEKNGGL
jgi:regulator of cell morphogenesis and NO signaling